MEVAEAPAYCCESASQAAWKGHYDCFQDHSIAPHSHLDTYHDAIRSGLRRGNVDFAKRLFSEQLIEAFWFAWHCITFDDVAALRFTLDTVPSVNRDTLAKVARGSIGCLRVLLESGARWPPSNLRHACIHNRLDILELVLQHSRQWCGRVVTTGACAGNTRFLMRMFEAGCPVWTSARDGEPDYSEGRFDHRFFPPGEKT